MPPLSSASLGSEFDTKSRTLNAVVVVTAVALGYLCESFSDLSTLATTFSTALYFICDAGVWPLVGRLVPVPISPELANLVVSILISVVLPDAVLLAFVGPLKCLSCLWLCCLQACVVVDAAHEVHAFVLRRAEHVGGGRLLHAAHLATSTLLLLLAARVIADLPPLAACGSSVALAVHVLVAVGIICTLCSLSERCNKGALIPGAVALYSALCCHDALLATNHNTGYLYFARCYYGPDSAGPGTDAAARLVAFKNNTSAALTAVAAACTVYAAATGSPTLVFFYDRLAVACCPATHGANARCLVRLGRSCLDRIPGAGTAGGSNSASSTSSSSGGGSNGNIIATAGDPEALRYRELDTEYRFEVDEEVAAKLKQAGNSAAAQMCFVTSTPAAGGMATGATAAAVSTAERSLLLPLSSVSSSSSSSVGSGGGLAMCCDCDTRTADARYASPALGGHYRIVLFVLFSAASAYLCCEVTDWAGYLPAEPTAEARATRWRPADNADVTVFIKLAGAFAPWAVYAAALVNSYLVYVEHNRKLIQLIHV